MLKSTPQILELLGRMRDSVPVSIKCEYLGGGVSIRDRRIKLGLGLSSVVDSLEAFDLN